MADGYTVPLAAIDYIPNFLFLFAVIILRSYFKEFSLQKKFRFVIIGGISVFIGGILKSTWKLILAMTDIDVRILDDSLWVFQVIGFGLIFYGTILFQRQFNNDYLQNKKQKIKNAVPMILLAIWEIPLLILQVIFWFTSLGVLIYHSFKQKVKTAGFFFMLTLICTLVMSGLGSNQDLSIEIQWVAEFVNIFSQLAFLIGTFILRGLKENMPE